MRIGASTARGSAVWTTAMASMALAATVGLLVITRWGIGTSPDSVRYIRAARQIVTEGTAAATQALTHYAPLYPLALAAGGAVGHDVVEWARWLNAAVFGLNVFVAGLIVGRSVPEVSWLGIAASALVAGSMPSLGAHVVALSEPMFLLLTLVGLGFVGLHLEKPSLGRLVAAGATLGLAAFTRYAGAACLLTAAIGLLVFGTAPMVRRIRDAFVVGAMGALPLLAWKAAHLSAGAGPAREFAFHPVGRSHAWQAIYTASAWMLVPASAPNVVRLVVLAALAVAVVLAVFVRWRRNMPTRGAIAVLALFLPVYAGFLAVSLSFFDANTPLDDRILLPAFVAGLLVCLSVCGGAAAVLRAPAPAVLAGLVVVFATGHGARTAATAADGYARGWGFSSVTWRQSPILERVGAFPPDTVIYSNVPEIVYLHTGRDPRPLPRRMSLVTRRSNERFDGEVAALGRELRERCGVVAYVRGVTEGSSIVPARMLEERLSLGVRWSGPDGSILGVPGCAR